MSCFGLVCNCSAWYHHPIYNKYWEQYFEIKSLWRKQRLNDYCSDSYCACVKRYCHCNCLDYCVKRCKKCRVSVQNEFERDWRRTRNSQSYGTRECKKCLISVRNKPLATETCCYANTPVVSKRNTVVREPCGNIPPVVSERNTVVSVPRAKYKPKSDVPKAQRSKIRKTKNVWRKVESSSESEEIEERNILSKEELYKQFRLVTVVHRRYCQRVGIVVQNVSDEFVEELCDYREEIAEGKELEEERMEELYGEDAQLIREEKEKMFDLFQEVLFGPGIHTPPEE